MADGHICLDILRDQWSPALRIETVVLTIQALLSDPNPEDAVTPEPAIALKYDIPGYNRIAREWTERFAGCECKMCGVVEMRYAVVRCYRLLQLGRGEPDNSRLGLMVKRIVDIGESYWLVRIICELLLPDEEWPMSRLHTDPEHRCRFTTQHYLTCLGSKVLSGGLFPTYQDPTPFVDGSVHDDPVASQQAMMGRHASVGCQ